MAEGKQTFDLQIKASDMDKDWIEKGKDYVKNGLQTCKSEVLLAKYCKMEFDKAFGYGWNVIVGKRFGSFVFHRTKMYINFMIRDMNILIWQS